MKHYTSEEWADFARGVTGSKDKSMMQKHLDTGCTSCAKEAELWRRVKETAKRQSATEPSQGAVRYAKAMFAGRGHRAEVKEPVSVAQLLFDSAKSPALAGVRSVAAGPRQLLFGLGDHRIDLRMEPQLDSDKVMIMGQVLDSGNPQQLLSKIPVSLHLEGKLVAASETNDFGEFQLECTLVGRLQLSATLPHGEEISVSLIEPRADDQGHPYAADSIEEKKPMKAPENRTKGKV
jgi:hypothetical protein